MCTRDFQNNINKTRQEINKISEYKELLYHYCINDDTMSKFDLSLNLFQNIIHHLETFKVFQSLDILSIVCCFKTLEWDGFNLEQLILEEYNIEKKYIYDPKSAHNHGVKTVEFSGSITKINNITDNREYENLDQILHVTPMIELEYSPLIIRNIQFYNMDMNNNKITDQYYTEYKKTTLFFRRLLSENMNEKRVLLLLKLLYIQTIIDLSNSKQQNIVEKLVKRIIWSIENSINIDYTMRNLDVDNNNDLEDIILLSNENHHDKISKVIKQITQSDKIEFDKFYVIYAEYVSEYLLEFINKTSNQKTNCFEKVR